MSATVIVNFRTVVHKSSTGIATSVPDVCKTPAPPAPPVPIPYPNIARSSDTDKGSKKVKCDGNPIMLKDSKFSRSMGDEAGTLKGIVSNTNMGAAKFALYSFDVKVEGKNVPRLGDMMLTNGNASNSVCPAEGQPPAVVTPTPEQEVACAIYCCDQKKYPLVKRKGDKECQRLGTKKHSCVLHKLRKKSESGRLTQESRIPGLKAAPHHKVKGIKRTLIPDIRIGNKIIDVKFPCPKNIKNTPPLIAQPSDMSVPGQSMLTDKEKTDYKKIKGVKKVQAMSPKDAEKKKHESCKCEV